MKQNTTYTRNTKETTEKPVLANKTKHALVWYTSYDLRPGNGADPTLTGTPRVSHHIGFANQQHSLMLPNVQ